MFGLYLQPLLRHTVMQWHTGMQHRKIRWQWPSHVWPRRWPETHFPSRFQGGWKEERRESNFMPKGSPRSKSGEFLLNGLCRTSHGCLQRTQNLSKWWPLCILVVKTWKQISRCSATPTPVAERYIVEGRATHSRILVNSKNIPPLIFRAL